MKKNLFVVCIMCIVTLSVHAQLRVLSGGDVTVGLPSNGSQLHIYGKKGQKGIYMNCKADTAVNTSGVLIYPEVGVPPKASSYSGILAYSTPSTSYCYGVGGMFYKGSGSNPTGGAAGIFGSSTASTTMSQYPAVYAGYFRGDVRVTGSLYGTLLTPSGSTSGIAKANNAQPINLSSIEEESVTEKLQQVQLLQFYRSPDENKLSAEEIQDQRELIRQEKKARDMDMTSVEDAAKTEKEETNAADEQEDDIDKEIVTEVPQTRLATVKYGLAADQLKAVYPELVYEDDKGNVSINYIEMIPLLVQAINEINTENNRLKSILSEMQGKTSAQSKARKDTEIASSINTEDETILSLSQNRPNPFSTSTSIEVSVPESVNTAALLIFDMSGKQIKCIDITERGISQISITSEGLIEGMYLYSLIADGKVVGTKKMILVK